MLNEHVKPIDVNTAICSHRDEFLTAMPLTVPQNCEVLFFFGILISIVNLTQLLFLDTTLNLRVRDKLP